MTKHTYETLMRRLSRAGFNRPFVRAAILPDWWDDECANAPDLLPDIELRVARFLGLPLSTVQDPSTALAAPAYPGAQLRRVRDLDRERLAPAVHSALRIGAAVVRSLATPTASAEVPPRNGAEWRERIRAAHPAPSLDGILGDLWSRGIPVVPVDVLPTPNFQGIACIVEGRPVILIGHKHDEPGRLAFLVAHEAGHIAAGDCAARAPVVDQEDEILDDADMERRADQYAMRVLVGRDPVPEVEAADFKQLASHALQLEQKTGADASVIIFSWAARTGDYLMATMAVRALYRGSGGRELLLQHFDRHVDLDSASESDRTLLRCIHPDQVCDETPL